MARAPSGRADKEDAEVLWSGWAGSAAMAAAHNARGGALAWCRARTCLVAASCSLGSPVEAARAAAKFLARMQEMGSKNSCWTCYRSESMSISGESTTNLRKRKARSRCMRTNVPAS
eukprot:1048571-Amphidinium_carterae.1